MRDIINTISEEADITAVVDPPRAGLRKFLIQLDMYHVAKPTLVG